MKLALWQSHGIAGDVAANLEALERITQQAHAAGAGLLLCPECWLGGYNIGERVAQVAEPADGAAALRIAAIARGHDLAIAYGYAERADEGRIFNSVQVIGPAGLPLAHYRKTHLFGAQERASYHPGTGFAAPFEFAGLRIGLLICYDVEYPESVRTLALMGADLVLVPTALTEEYARVPDVIIPTRSLENQIFVAYCNRAGLENGMPFLGRSCVTGPDGHFLAAVGNGEALLYADIDPALRSASAVQYPYQSDRRPELYGLLSRPRAPSMDRSMRGDLRCPESKSPPPKVRS
jgi:predicted amidohydrolase